MIKVPRCRSSATTWFWLIFSGMVAIFFFMPPWVLWVAIVVLLLAAAATIFDWMPKAGRRRKKNNGAECFKISCREMREVAEAREYDEFGGFISSWDREAISSLDDYEPPVDRRRLWWVASVVTCRYCQTRTRLRPEDKTKLRFPFEPDARSGDYCEMHCPKCNAYITLCEKGRS